MKICSQHWTTLSNLDHVIFRDGVKTIVFCWTCSSIHSHFQTVFPSGLQCLFSSTQCSQSPQSIQYACFAPSWVVGSPAMVVAMMVNTFLKLFCFQGGGKRMFNVSNYWNLLLSRHSPQNTLSQSSPPSDCTPRLFQIIRLSDCTPRLSSGPAGFSLSPPRKSVKDAWLKTKSGSTTITCHQHQGWHFPWVSMYPRTKMTPQHMFMILWFSNNWGFNLIIKPTFRQGFPFLSLTPLEEKNCNWKVFKSCHAFVCLAFDYLVDWKSPRMRIWRIIPRIILPSNICHFMRSSGLISFMLDFV